MVSIWNKCFLGKLFLIVSNKPYFWINRKWYKSNNEGTLLYKKIKFNVQLNNRTYWAINFYKLSIETLHQGFRLNKIWWPFWTMTCELLWPLILDSMYAHTHMSIYLCMYVYVGKDFLNFYIVTKIWIQNKCSSQISISHFSSFRYAYINMLWFFKENNAILSKKFSRKKERKSHYEKCYFMTRKGG